MLRYSLFSSALTTPQPHSSRCHSTRLLALSSRALVRFAPQRALTRSRFCSCHSIRSGIAWAHMPTKYSEQPNFSASRLRVHIQGLLVRSFRISSISTAPKWYVFSCVGIGLIGGGKSGSWLSSDEVVRGPPELGSARRYGFSWACEGASKIRRGSERGRNSGGVW